MTLRKFGKLDDPKIHLASATPQLVSVCLTPSDTAQDCAGQTLEVLDRIERFLHEAGTRKERVLMAQVWLADITDLDSFNRVWNSWTSADAAPALSIVQAAAYSRDTLVEIRVYASA